MANFAIAVVITILYISATAESDSDECTSRLNQLEQSINRRITTLDKKIEELSKSDGSSGHITGDVLTRMVRTGPEVKVAFDAVLSASISHVGQNDLIKYNHVLTNIGQAYDPNTGIFQAPYAGTYLFSWTTQCTYHASIKTHLEKNGAIIATTHADGSNIADAHASATKVVIITLAAIDRIYIKGSQLSRGSIESSDNTGHSGFSGILIYA